MAQNGQDAPNGRYHSPDFSLKNAKLRLNIIFIDILRAARVFIAFTFPQPCECVVFQNSYAKESFLPYKSSMIALSDCELRPQKPYIDEICSCVVEMEDLYPIAVSFGFFVPNRGFSPTFQ